jgi:predicted ester cyclase
LSTPKLVAAFYERIWNAREPGAAAELLTEDFVFRGSLGDELVGREAFGGYARSLHAAFADYRCEIQECVAEGDRAFARMRFSGRHVGVFRGEPPTGSPVSWAGAALFALRGSRIASLWVLGDLSALDVMLRANRAG